MSLVTLHLFPSRIEAEIVKGLLQSYGIPSHVTADDKGGTSPQLALANGVKLLVDEKDKEKAMQVVAKSKKSA